MGGVISAQLSRSGAPKLLLASTQHTPLQGHPQLHLITLDAGRRKDGFNRLAGAARAAELYDALLAQAVDGSPRPELAEACRLVPAR